MLLRAVVQYPHAHFTPVRSREFLDGYGVKGGAQPCLRIQPEIHRGYVLLFFGHEYHLISSMPGTGEFQSEKERIPEAQPFARRNGR